MSYTRVWLVVNNYKDGIDYTVHRTKDAAKKKFLQIVKDLGKVLKDPMVAANDDDDFDELAEGGIYNAPNGDVIEITVGSMEDF
jgi:hypothetical protein